MPRGLVKQYKELKIYFWRDKSVSLTKDSDITQWDIEKAIIELKDLKDRLGKEKIEFIGG